MNRTHAFELLSIPLELLTVHDRDICPKVIQMGYDSVQIFNSLVLKEAELIFCTGGCATQIVSSSCPPMELRSGYNATKPCYCNSSYPILNCNNKVTDALDCHNIDGGKLKKKQTCFFEDFTWINEFRYESPLIAIFFSWHRRSGLGDDLTILTSTIAKYKNDGWGTILVDSGHLLHLSNNVSEVLQKMDSMQYDIVPVRDSIASRVTRTSSYKFHMLSLTNPDFLRSAIIHRGGVKVGFISYSVDNLSIDEVVQLVIDEALCLKRWADLIVLLGGEQPHADSYVADAVSKFVDITLGGNAQMSTSCTGHWHTSNDNLVVRSQHDNSYLTLVSIEVLSSTNYAMKSDTIKL